MNFKKSICPIMNIKSLLSFKYLFNIFFKISIKNGNTSLSNIIVEKLTRKIFL